MKAAPPMPAANVLALAEENLSAARLIVRGKCPYYLPALLSFTPKPTPGMGTISSTKNFLLSYDPDFIAKTPVDEIAGLLVHEISHIWNHHFDRVGDRDQDRANRAMDRAINPPILEAGFKLPAGGCMPKAIGMPDNLTFEEYYEKEPEDPPGEGGNGGKCGSGGCGGCAGNPGEDEPDEQEQAADGRTEAQVERVLREVAEGINDAVAKGIGRIPGAWQRLASDYLKPSVIPWQEALAYAARSAMAYRDGATTHRYDFPSRRQSGLGFGDGVPILPRMREEVPDVFVAIDTSGSMGGPELTEVLVEVRGIMQATGATIQLCVIDADIHGMATVASIEEVAGMLKGGGGTDFRPAFDAAMEAQPRPSLIIFMTDGYGPAPAHEQIPTIWVYVGEHVRKAAPWGTHIRVPPPSGKTEMPEATDDGY